MTESKDKEIVCKVSEECTDKGKDSSSEIVLCQGSVQYPIGLPRGPPMVDFYRILKLISCAPQEYRHIRKEGMTNIQISRDSLELVRVDPQAHPLLKCVYFFHGMTSAPENLDYNLQTWHDISHQLIGGNSFEIGNPIGLYLIAWTIYNCAEYGPLPNNSETILSLGQLKIPPSKNGAMELIDYCISETESISNFPLKPYFHITKLRWEFEYKRFMGDLDESVAKALLKRIEKMVHQCNSFDHEWMKVDSFGARVSAINLIIEIANCFKEKIPEANMFRSLKEEAEGNLKMLTEYLQKNRSDIPKYDKAWLYSVQSKFHCMNGADSQAHRYAKRAVRLYLECGRHWRALEDAKHTRDTNLIRYCESRCRAVRVTQPPYYRLNTH